MVGFRGPLSGTEVEDGFIGRGLFCSKEVERELGTGDHRKPKMEEWDGEGKEWGRRARRKENGRREEEECSEGRGKVKMQGKSQQRDAHRRAKK